MLNFVTNSAEETVALGKKIGLLLSGNEVVAMFGGMGMGKTAFTHGLAEGLGIDPKQVNSPTFALVHEYSGNHTLYHFDMYRIESWDDLYSTGFFDYLDFGGVLAVEWSENIENALPENTIKIHFEKGENDFQRIITVDGGADFENSCN